MIWFLAGAAVGAIFGFYVGLTLTSWPPLAPDGRVMPPVVKSVEGVR
jgi:hypothetical protein